MLLAPWEISCTVEVYAKSKIYATLVGKFPKTKTEE